MNYKNVISAIVFSLALLVGLNANAAPTCSGGLNVQYFIATDTSPGAQVYDPNRGFVANNDATYLTWLTGTSPCLFGNTSISAAANNGGGAARLTLTSTANLTTNQRWQVFGTTTYDGTWQITVINGTQIDLVGSAFSTTVSTGALYGPQLVATAAAIYTNVNNFNAQIPQQSRPPYVQSTGVNQTITGNWPEVIVVTATAGGVNITLPPANIIGALPIGKLFTVVNSGNRNWTLKTSAGGSSIVIPAASTSVGFVFSANGTVDGTLTGPLTLPFFNGGPASSGVIPITGAGTNDQFVFNYSGMSGDCTNNTSLAVTCTKTNGVSFAASATTDATNMGNAASGTLVVGRGGTGDTGTAWSTFTPTITCGAGTVTSYTTQSGRYKTLGKTIFYSIKIQLNNAGTCSGTITINGLPVATNATNTCQLSGTDYATNKAITGNGGSNVTTMQVLNYDNTNPAVTFIITLNGVCETT